MKNIIFTLFFFFSLLSCKNKNRTFEEVKESVENGGDADDQFLLSEMYRNGIGTPENYRSAFKWLKKSAAQGHKKAQFNLAAMYEHQSEYDFGKNDYKSAMKWYKKSAKQGISRADFNIAMLYFEGKGVEKNEKMGLELIRKSAKKGVPEAQSKLGLMYKNGEFVKKDYKKAFQLFQKGSEKGIAMAQYNLGTMYFFGLGTPKDLQTAKAWIKYSYENGSEEAIDFWEKYDLGSEKGNED